MDVSIEGVDAEAERQEAVDGLYNYVARLGPRSRVAPGQMMTFAVDTDRIHYFDPVSGESIWA